MKQRVYYYDYLRVFAIIAVILLHIAAQEWSGLTGRDTSWQIFNVFNSISRWGVSVFLMISGSLFLSRDIDIRTIYKKYITRMVVSYFLWSAIYALFAPKNTLYLGAFSTFSLKDFITSTLVGPVHLWFIPMIVGIYMCIPLIRQIVVSKKLLDYYLLLGFVFAYAVPQMVYLTKDFATGFAKDFLLSVNTLISDMNVRIVIGFVYIFVLGYFLAQTEFTKKQRQVIYILGIIGFCSTIILNAVVGWKTDAISKNYYQTFTINVLFEAVSVFVWFKYRKLENEKLNRFVSKLSEYSFGAYLIHILVMAAFRLWGFSADSFNPVLCVPALTVTTVVISFVLSFLINKIPFLNKWIV
ncbi:MAG: acyltransferase family protein [Clostridia bacterium]|nr:acyltransferase family protein [Clostridia bacterium]